MPVYVAFPIPKADTIKDDMISRKVLGFRTELCENVQGVLLEIKEF